MAGNKVGKRGQRRSAQTWRLLIEEWQETGLELAQFCSERGIPPSSLKWWRWRLGISANQSPSKPAVLPQKVGSPPAWIRLKVDTPVSAGKTPFELRWPDGLVLAIPADFDSLALNRLLSLLERPAC